MTPDTLPQVPDLPQDADLRRVLGNAISYQLINVNAARKTKLIALLNAAITALG